MNAVSLKSWQVTVTRAVVLAVAGVAAAALCVPSIGDRIIYNGSASMPHGFYFRTAQGLTRGAIVTIRARDMPIPYIAIRGFSDANDRFLKRIAAVAGDEVCANGPVVTVNGDEVAERISHDAAGRQLPSWSDCRMLTEGEVLLLGDTPDSFDGRYWGITSSEHIEAVWRRVAGTGN